MESSSPRKWHLRAPVTSRLQKWPLVAKQMVVLCCQRCWGNRHPGSRLGELAHPSLVVMLSLVTHFGGDQQGAWTTSALYQFQHPLQGNTSHVPAMSLDPGQGRSWLLTAEEGVLQPGSSYMVQGHFRLCKG